MHDDQVAPRQQALETGGELFTRVRPKHTLRERTVGLLQHAREAELDDDLVGARAAADDHRRRDRKVEPFRELDQIDLVAAADDRLGIVDDDEALGTRAAGEPIGVMVHGRGRTDE